MERTILALRHVEDGLLELGAIRSQSFSVRGETRHEGEEALMDMKKAFFNRFSLLSTIYWSGVRVGGWAGL